MEIQVGRLRNEVLVGAWKRLVMNMLGSVDAKADMKKEEEQSVGAREKVESSMRNLSVGVWDRGYERNDLRIWRQGWERNRSKSRAMVG